MNVTRRIGYALYLHKCFAAIDINFFFDFILNIYSFFMLLRFERLAVNGAFAMILYRSARVLYQETNIIL